MQNYKILCIDHDKSLLEVLSLARKAGAAGFIFKPALNLQKPDQMVATHLPQKEVIL